MQLQSGHPSRAARPERFANAPALSAWHPRSLPKRSRPPSRQPLFTCAWRGQAEWKRCLVRARHPFL